MNSKLIAVAVMALLIGGLAGYAMAGGPERASEPGTETAEAVSLKKVDFRNAMRKLWEDHVTWTRLYIVEAAAGTPGVNETAGRLLKNQEDIGNAVKPFYGEEAGNRLTTLLKEHITIAVDILNAAKAGDSEELQRAHDEWHRNANDIAVFLNGANPGNWDLVDMQEGMNMHLEMTMDEAVAQLEGRYAESVMHYDMVHDHILALADDLSAGIIAQFPERF